MPPYFQFAMTGHLGYKIIPSAILVAEDGRQKGVGNGTSKKVYLG
jgi:hypothetical protein